MAQSGITTIKKANERAESRGDAFDDFTVAGNRLACLHYDSIPLF